MKKMLKKLDAALSSAKIAARNFVTSERGDTNFVSIAIILVVVIVIAVLFITLGQKLSGELGTKIQELLDALGI